MTTQKNVHIGSLAVMQKKPNHSYALSILKDIAHRVSYLMREHKLKVGQVVEFYPKNKRLLGMNVNRGAKIMLRLRQPFNEEEFLPREDILGTMLHELTHNMYGPHNALFYKKLDELTARTWVIESQGLYDGFIGRGRKLGVKPVGKTPPRRLGTSTGRSVGAIKSASEMAALAAQKRACDAQWCASSSSTAAPRPQDLQVIEIDSDGEDIAGRPGVQSGNKPESREVIDLT
ncbi:LAQU0S05e03378g1_1 [Lachancea quebecensis]|uniref:LAQU0S05e03378g1_1 n=1 Tax=Lachancea quebecensis TaxID=1654605 RepID=A0A0P1KQZ8_9SACH|nr:LAQU0S05e03378g1_1 [Lachancea quebecensis]